MKHINSIYGLDSSKVYMYIHYSDDLKFGKCPLEVDIIKFHRIKRGSTIFYDFADCSGYQYKLNMNGLVYFCPLGNRAVYSDWTKYLFELTEEEVIEHFILGMI